MNENAIIVFSRNTLRGNVKTRIGAEVGDTKALEIYEELLYYTEKFLEEIKYQIYIYWEKEIPEKPIYFNKNSYLKRVQKGKDLGERMESSFHEVLKNHEKAVIIGTDCPYLKAIHLENAFSSLTIYDYCVGPTEDGGYYLLGLKNFSSRWFQNIPWSTEHVYTETQKRAEEMNLNGYILPMLSDVDTYRDYCTWKQTEN